MCVSVCLCEYLAILTGEERQDLERKKSSHGHIHACNQISIYEF